MPILCTVQEYWCFNQIRMRNVRNASTAVERFLGTRDGRIGVTVRPVAARVADMPVLGLMVIELEAGGPAHLSGVLIGDVIVRAEEEWLNRPEQLSDAIQMAAHVLSIDLSSRGLEVLAMLAEGLGNKDIASRLKISEHTVKFHVSSILGKLRASTRGEAVAHGVREGLIVI